MPNIPLEADHLEERVHNLKVDDALYDATARRLRAALDHLAASRKDDDEADRIGRRLERLTGKLAAVKTSTVSYFEVDPYDRTKAADSPGSRPESGRLRREHGAPLRG